MTVKQFLQSKIMKCILVLLCIALVSGGLLAILNDLWAVSDEEIVNRAIKSLCGDGITLKETITTEKVQYRNGEVNEVYLLSDGNYLVKATGYHGLHEGNVSVYVLAKFNNGTFENIEKVSIASYSSSQTLMSKFNEDALAKFANDTNTVVSGASSSTNTVITGASYSSKAVGNGVASAKYYITHDLKKEAV